MIWVTFFIIYHINIIYQLSHSWFGGGIILCGKKGIYHLALMVFFFTFKFEIYIYLYLHMDAIFRQYQYSSEFLPSESIQILKTVYLSLLDFIAFLKKKSENCRSIGYIFSITSLTSDFQAGVLLKSLRSHSTAQIKCVIAALFCKKFPCTLHLRYATGEVPKSGKLHNYFGLGVLSWSRYYMKRSRYILDALHG